MNELEQACVRWAKQVDELEAENQRLLEDVRSRYHQTLEAEAERDRLLAWKRGVMEAHGKDSPTQEADNG